MCNTPPIVPCPVRTDEGVQRLMLPDTLDDSVSSRLIVTALDVEVTQQGLEDQGGQQGNPRLQQVDERSVGAELLEDLFGEASLKEPCSIGFPRGEDDCSKAVVHGGIVLRLPSIGDGIVWSEALLIGSVICIGVDDRKMSGTRLSGYSHRPTM